MLDYQRVSWCAAAAAAAAAEQMHQLDPILWERIGPPCLLRLRWQWFKSASSKTCYELCQCSLAASPL